MEYQVNINYRFQAVNEREAKEKAKSYLTNNLKVQSVPGAVCSPLEIAEQCWDFRKKDKEHFTVFFLNTQNQIISREIISIGTLNCSLIHPRECFKTAILKSAAGVIFAHNHPSGGLEPSAEDIAVTKRLADVGKLIGIEVVDHVIVTSESHKSMKEERLI
jgi:DNA repair protein RadC